ncbi:cupin domain-containing protein [Lentzea tibetensis]|uniref:Cupin domain-containing protein n=1 Tax=Lentzea tibetensis TaxID=2591470 RepID=A0A563EV73_9PSEU|nr:cupin domain-containing protein [Lentzea tibetensis]TWP51627.1 cupin domain-containing protein [Lentzea tibetensis]
MPLATAADAPVFERGGFVFRSLAVPSRGSAEIAMWTVDVPEGADSEPHQIDKEEVFYVLTGNIRIQGVDAGPGDAVICSAFTDITLVGGPARLLVTTSVGATGILADGQKIVGPWSL